MSDADRSGPIRTYLNIGVQLDSWASSNLPADQILLPRGAMPRDLIRTARRLQQILPQGWGQLQRLALHGCLRFKPSNSLSFSSPTYAGIGRFWSVALHYPWFNRLVIGKLAIISKQRRFRASLRGAFSCWNPSYLKGLKNFFVFPPPKFSTLCYERLTSKINNI